MIIKLVNSENGDEQLLNIPDYNAILSDIKIRVQEYEEKYGYGCTVGGLLNYLRDHGYNVGKIDYIPKIEFNH